jgi:hypothetical protein
MVESILSHFLSGNKKQMLQFSSFKNSTFARKPALLPLMLSVGLPAPLADTAYLEDHRQLMCSAGSGVGGHFPVGIGSALPEGTVVSGAVLPDVLFAGHRILAETEDLPAFAGPDLQLVTGLQFHINASVHTIAPSILSVLTGFSFHIDSITCLCYTVFKE